MQPLSVHMHCYLQGFGGAFRVLQLLEGAQTTADISLSYTTSYEVLTQQDKDKGSAIDSASVYAHAVKQGSDICHVHTTGSWVDFLQGCAQVIENTAKKNTVKKLPKVCITVHDTALLTGGCADPLGCEQWKTGCNVCPQGFARVGEVQQQQDVLLDMVKPLLISPSQWLLDLFKQRHPHLTYELCPNGVESLLLQQGLNVLGKESKNHAKKTLGIPIEKKVLLFLAHGGEKARNKSGPQWLDTFQAILAQQPDAFALFVGGAEQEQAETFLRIPYVQSSSVNMLFCASDLLVYPTLADNHSLVILESLASGVPPVAFGVGGVPEQITHEYNGIIVPSGNFKALIRWVVALLNNGHLLETMSKNVLKTWQGKFTQKHMQDGYVQIYKSMYNAADYAD